jgi:hypothetical protein
MTYSQGQYPQGQYPANQYPANQYGQGAYAGYGAPRRGGMHPLTALGAVVAVLGVVIAIVLYIAGQQRFSSSVKHLVTEAGALSGCATDLTFTEGGNYTLYYVSSGSVRLNGANDGCAAADVTPIAADTSPPDFALTLADIDGTALKLSAPGTRAALRSSGVVALPYRQVTVPASGSYRLSVGAPDTGLPFAIGVGKRISEPGAFLPLAVGLIGIILGVGCALGGLASAGRSVGYGAAGQYQQPGYQQPGYQQPGYQQPGYQQPAAQQPGYRPSGYAQPGAPPTVPTRAPAPPAQRPPESRPPVPRTAPRPQAPAPSYRPDPGPPVADAPPTVANPVPPTIRQESAAGLPPIVSAAPSVDPLLAPSAVEPPSDPNAIWRRDEPTPIASTRPPAPPTQPMPVQRPERTPQHDPDEDTNPT